MKMHSLYYYISHLKKCAYYRPQSTLICRELYLSCFGSRTVRTNIDTLRSKLQSNASSQCISKHGKVFCTSNRYRSLSSRPNQSLLPRSTIFAACSGHGKCGITVFRISGSQASVVLSKVAHMNESLKPRRAYLRHLYHPISKVDIDRGIVLWFPGPFSVTGEDCVELHVHGGKAVTSAIIEALGSISGLRYAEAGEFTKRSFENGKLDLTQVEGLADLLDAETEAQRKQALRQLDGSYRTLYSSWQETLVQCCAHIDAYIDFSEEEHIEDDLMNIVCRRVVLLQREMRLHLVNGRCSERVRNGVRIAIVGEPNVGKSSLFNMLCERPAAIVSPQAGTTRDVIDASLDVAGFPVIISDTAGLHKSTDPVEAEGVCRAIKKAAEADILLVVVDSSDTSVLYRIQQQEITVEEFIADHLCRLGLASDCEHEAGTVGERQILLLLNKKDLLDDSTQKQLMEVLSQSLLFTTCLVSCQVENGMQDFLHVLQNKVSQLCTVSPMECIGVTHARHRHHLVSCLKFLQAFTLLHFDNDVVLAAQDLRRAMHQISKIMGHVTSDDILDVIFRDFCIGK